MKIRPYKVFNGINDLRAADISVYPNPVVNEVNFKGINGASERSLFFRFVVNEVNFKGINGTVTVMLFNISGKLIIW